jgi:hypothetical protein
MPVAPRKICYNFAMWERENNFLGPLHVFQKIYKKISWGHLHALEAHVQGRNSVQYDVKLRKLIEKMIVHVLRGRVDTPTKGTK